MTCLGVCPNTSRYVLYRYRNLGIRLSLHTLQNLNACCEYGFQPESRVGQSFHPVGCVPLPREVPGRVSVV